MNFKTTIEIFSVFDFGKCGPLLSFSGRPENVDHLLVPKSQGQFDGILR